MKINVRVLGHVVLGWAKRFWVPERVMSSFVVQIPLVRNQLICFYEWPWWLGMLIPSIAGEQNFPVLLSGFRPRSISLLPSGLTFASLWVSISRLYEKCSWTVPLCWALIPTGKICLLHTYRHRIRDPQIIDASVHFSVMPLPLSLLHSFLPSYLPSFIPHLSVTTMEETLSGALKSNRYSRCFPAQGVYGLLGIDIMVINASPNGSRSSLLYRCGRNVQSRLSPFYYWGNKLFWKFK